MRPVRRVLLLVFCFGCGPETPGEGPGGEGDDPTSASPIPSEAVVVIDAAGRTLTLDSIPQRILSLVPSASHTLLGLGEGDRLVGRTEYDTAAVLAHLPSVGGGLQPNLEAILSLDPDLVIRFAGNQDRITPSRLDDWGIPHMAIRPDGIRDVRGIIRTLGVLTGARERADSLLDRMDATLAQVRDRVGDRPGVRVAYLLGGSPPWVAGPGSYVDELLEVAGGINVFRDLSGLYGPVNPEAFLDRRLDLLLAAEGSAVTSPIPGLPLRRVSPSVEIPGHHLAEAAMELAKILHPEAFR